MRTVFGWNPKPAGSLDLGSASSHQGQPAYEAGNVFYGKRPLVEMHGDGVRINAGSAPSDIDDIVVTVDDGNDGAVVAVLSRSADGFFDIE